QIVGTQAVFNVLAGERYKMVSAETKGVLKGEYGKLPAEPNPKVIKQVLGDAERITCRPADLLKPELAKYREEIKEYIEQDEDVLSYALFPQVALNFFKYRQANKKHVDREVGDTTKGIQPV
ncbi:MAG: oxaloacetate decarboxylase subunit alpha, partial [Clostridia bacterium]|nr:oxaloacetate decarboxylase subunit alpha [Clostridia bacterium]